MLFQNVTFDNFRYKLCQYFTDKAYEYLYNLYNNTCIFVQFDPVDLGNTVLFKKY